jgi:hypothetical protein
MVKLSPDPELLQFIKPTVDTPFHIDYDWLEQQGVDVNILLLAHLCSEHRDAYQGQQVNEAIDWVDWETGEVRQVDGLQYIIATHCSQQSGYVTKAPTLLEAVFRVFLGNGNRPLTPTRLASLVGHSANRVLRVLSTTNARKGVRPVLPELS